MSERIPLSEVAFLNNVSVPGGNRDLNGRFLPRGGAWVCGRATMGGLTRFELLYWQRPGLKPGLRRGVSPGLLVCDLGPEAQKPLINPEQYNGN